MADQTDQAAAVTFTEDQFKALLNIVTPKPGVVASAASAVGSGVSAVAAEVGAASKVVAADVKAFPWGHVVTFLASTGASIGAHMLHLFGL